MTTRGGSIQEGILAGVTSVVGYRALEAVARARGWTTVTRVLHETGNDSLYPPSMGAPEPATEEA